MNGTARILLFSSCALLCGASGCARSPEDETRRALARVEHYMGFGSGGNIEYDEASPGRPPITITLEGTPILNAALRPLGKLTTLRTLNLASTGRFTDDGLRHLRGLINLQSFNLREAGISNAGLEHLAGLTSLEYVDLSKNPQITNAGLRWLHGLHQLRSLDLSETGVTEAGIKELRKALPGIEILR